MVVKIHISRFNMQKVYFSGFWVEPRNLHFKIAESLQGFWYLQSTNGTSKWNQGILNTQYISLCSPLLFAQNCANKILEICPSRELGVFFSDYTPFQSCSRQYLSLFRICERHGIRLFKANINKKVYSCVMLDKIFTSSSLHKSVIDAGVHPPDPILMI